MSTILDALKRSEQERKPNQVPTLLDMPTPQERPRWPLFLLGALLVLLFAVLIWVLLSVKPPETQIQSTVVNNETVNDVSADQEVGVSDSIKVSVISYAQDPSARFVITNGKLFREGEFVMAGVKVESILQDSVVFIERGKRVTRQP